MAYSELFMIITGFDHNVVNKIYANEINLGVFTLETYGINSQTDRPVLAHPA